MPKEREETSRLGDKGRTAYVYAYVYDACIEMRIFCTSVGRVSLKSPLLRSGARAIGYSFVIARKRHSILLLRLENYAQMARLYSYSDSAFCAVHKTIALW